MNTITITHEDQIWKIIPHQNEKSLALECRNATSKETYFQILDLQTGILNPKKIALNEKWWITLQAFTGQYLVVSYYDNAQYANMKGFTLIDIVTGKVVWFKKNIHFLKADNQFVLTYNALLKEEEILDIITGEVVNVSKLSFKPQKKIIYPDIFTEENDSFAKISHFIKRKKSVDPKGQIEYLEHDSIIIMVYYTGKPSNWSKYIYILNKNGENLKVLKVVDNLKGWSDYSFFIHFNKLILIKDAQTVDILDI